MLIKEESSVWEVGLLLSSPLRTAGGSTWGQVHLAGPAVAATGLPCVGSIPVAISDVHKIHSILCGDRRGRGESDGARTRGGLTSLVNILAYLLESSHQCSVAINNVHRILSKKSPVAENTCSLMFTNLKGKNENSWLFQHSPSSFLGTVSLEGYLSTLHFHLHPRLRRRA